MADGSIVFDTKIDRSGFEKDYAQLKKDATNLTKALNETEKDITNAQKDVQKIINGRSDAQMEFDMKMDPNLEAEMNQALDKVVEMENAYYELSNEKKEVDAQLANAEAEKPILNELEKAYDKYGQLVEKQKEFIAQDISPESAKLQKLGEQIDESKDKVSELIQKLGEVDTATANTTNQAFEELKYGQKDMLTQYQQVLGQQKLQNQQHEQQKQLLDTLKDSINTFSQGMEDSTKKTGNLINGLYKKFTGLATMIKMRFKRKLISAFMTGLTTGMSNLKNYSTEVSNSLTAMQASATNAYNGIASAVAPLLNTVAPAISKIIDLFASASNAIARFFAILTGQKSYTVATKNASALASANEDVATSADDASEAEGNLASIDELNDISSSSSSSSGSGGSSGTDYSSMFGTVALDGLSSFEKKFEVIASNIKGTIKALGDAWTEAWNFNGNGDAIISAIKGMADDVVDMLVGITESTKNWAQNLNLVPLVTGIRDVMESLEPIINKITDAIQFIWDELMLPIASWFAESLIPLSLEQISAFLDVINGLIQAMSPVLQTLWTTILQPLFDFLANTVSGIFEILVGWMQAIATWIEQHQTLVQVLTTFIIAIAGAVGGFIEALKLLDGVFNTVQTTMGIVSGVTEALGGVFSWLASPLGIAVVAIGAVIAILVLLVTHWDEVKEVCQKVANKIVELWGKVQSKFQEFDTWLTGVFSTDWTNQFGVFGNVLNAFCDTARNIWETIKGVFKGVITFLTGTFSGNWRQAWQGIKEIFNSIVSGLGNAIKTPINYIIDCINSFIRSVNRIKIPSWVPIVGGRGFSISTIPRLATGTVVPPNAGEFAAILGDNKKETEVVSPLSTIKQAVREELGNSSNNRTNQLLEALIQVVQNKNLLVSDVGKAVADYANAEYARTGETLFEGV